MSSHQSRQIEDIVRGNLPPASRNASLRPDDDLFEAGLDSLAVAALVTDIEILMGVPFAADQMSPDNFRTLRSIEACVARIPRS